MTIKTLEHWTLNLELQIERSNLYFRTLGKMAQKETYFSLISVICDICWFHSKNLKVGASYIDFISEQVQSRIWRESEWNDKHPACALVPSPSSVSWVQLASYLLTLASLMAAWYWVFAMRRCTVAKRVSPRKTICERKIWFPVCRILSVFVLSIFCFFIFFNKEEK